MQFFCSLMESIITCPIASEINFETSKVRSNRLHFKQISAACHPSEVPTVLNSVQLWLSFPSHATMSAASHALCKSDNAANICASQNRPWLVCCRECRPVRYWHSTLLDVMQLYLVSVPQSILFNFCLIMSSNMASMICNAASLWRQAKAFSLSRPLGIWRAE